MSPPTVQDIAAAWGDPAIVVTCGAPAPTDPATQVVTVDGTDWRFWRLAHGYRFRATTMDPVIEVAVPDHYDPAVDVLSELLPHLAR